MFDRGFTDGLPVVPPTEERVLRMLQGHDSCSRRRGRRRAARPGRGHGREDRDQRGDGRLQARVPAVGDRRGRGGLHRRVQHPRRARHHDAGRAGHRLQRPRHAGDRHERRGQRASAGQPGQPHHRPRRAAGRAQRRRRPTGRGRPGHARQPRQDQLLLRRARGRRRRSPRSRPASASPPDTNAVTVFAGEGPRCIVDQLARDPESLANTFAACLRTLHHPKLVLGFRRHPRDRARARPRVRRGRLGSRAAARRAARPAADPRQRAGPRRRRHRRGRARAPPRRDAAQVPPRRHPARARRRRRRVVLGDDRRLGQRRHRLQAGHGRRSVGRVRP